MRNSDRNSVRNRNGRGRRFMILALKVAVNVVNSVMVFKGNGGETEIGILKIVPE